MASDQWEMVDPDIQERAKEILRNAIQPEDVELIKEGHSKYGDEWIHHVGGHFFMGMAIRNLLRQNGLTDDLLPPVEYEEGQSYSNWDDYYVQAVEAAIGLRG